MKHIIVGITMRSGEYEATQHMVYELEDQIDIDNYADTIAENFYSDSDGKEYEDSNEYMFDSGSIITYVSSIDEISEREFDLFKKYF